MIYKILDAVIRKRRDLQLKKYIDSIPEKVASMRSKEKIKVAFVLHEAALWKTEKLYLTMLEHPRFEPMICTTLSGEGELSSITKKYLQLLDYLGSKGYKYIEVRNINGLDTDIVFYEKPYDQSYWPDVYARRCKSLIAYVPYGFNNYDISGAYNLECIIRSFQFYVENDVVMTTLKGLMDNMGKNIVATGIPIMDTLMEGKNNFLNPWHSQGGNKKKIIWAPHFSIRNEVSWLELSSFLMMSEGMLQLAKKYETQIQFAFKPHPILYNKLVKEWGLERTSKYYKLWGEMPNTQLETGEYIGLFKHSDAMIHDCGSFLTEYLYTGNPVLYMARDVETTKKQLSKLGQESYEKLYHGSTMDDVEEFICNVIDGKDPKKEERISYCKQKLTPPNGKSACDNIMDSILGINGYN